MRLFFKAFIVLIITASQNMYAYSASGEKEFSYYAIDVSLKKAIRDTLSRDKNEKDSIFKIGKSKDIIGDLHNLSFSVGTALYNYSTDYENHELLKVWYRDKGLIGFINSLESSYDSKDSDKLVKSFLGYGVSTENYSLLFGYQIIHRNVLTNSDEVISNTNDIVLVGDIYGYEIGLNGLFNFEKYFNTYVQKEFDILASKILPGVSLNINTKEIAGYTSWKRETDDYIDNIYLAMALYAEHSSFSSSGIKEFRVNRRFKVSYGFGFEGSISYYNSPFTKGIFGYSLSLKSALYNLSIGINDSKIIQALGVTEVFGSYFGFLLGKEY